MATSTFSCLLLILSLLPLFSSSTTPNLHKLRFTTSQLLASSSNSIPLSDSPTTYFEVTRPISLPQTSPCSVLLLQHDFAYTYQQPPVTAQYTPPSCLTTHDPSSPSRIVLEWTATCKGRQFDRIFGIWLAGVEILRSCTAEPRPNGIVWSVRKDITKYSSLFHNNSTLAVYLGNLVDSTYTGVYHVNLSVHFYFDSSPSIKKVKMPAFGSPADLILPVSRNLPLNDGLWFLIQNSTDIQSKDLVIPSNSYRAVLEVYISFHQDDEFWYTNPPNDYISQNNLTDTPGNGAFREVTVSLDGNLVGAIWPFTVIYTGGINPLLWRPITGIGSFNLPSYNLEITPFLGKLLDGNLHKFGFGVTNALDVWYVDANLHLWLDHKSSKTIGDLISHKAPELKPGLHSNVKGLDGKFRINVNRRISSSGWVKSSFGKITTRFLQELHYKNSMKFSNNGSAQLVQQTIQSTYTTYAKNPSSVVYREELHQTSPLYVYTGSSDKINDSYSLVTNLSLGFEQKQVKYGGQLGLMFGSASLTNLQNAQGEMKVKGNLVTSGLGKTQEVYKYEGIDGCYFRNVSSSNYTMLFDISEDSCAKMKNWVVGFIQ